MSLRDKLKRAWFQGADEPSKEGEITSNNPKTLGYPREISYNKKPMETSAPNGQDSRPWEQRWFEDSADETKKVMGPNGKEFELKQKMQRIPMDEKIANARLSATFTRTAKPQTSFWTVSAINKKTRKKEVILKANLEQLWGKELNEKNAKMSASKEYGKEIISRIRKQGFAKVAYLMTGNTSFIKKAQEMNQTPVVSQEDIDVIPAVEEAADEDAMRADATSSELEKKLQEVEVAETKLLELLPETAVAAGHELQAVEEELEAAIAEEKEIAARLRDRTISASAKIAIMKIAQEAFDDVTENVLPGADEVMQSAEDLLEKADEAIAKIDEIVEESEEVATPKTNVEETDVEETDVEETDVEVIPEGAESPVEVDVKASAKRELTVAEIKNFLTKRAEEQKYNVVPAGAPKDGREEIALAHPDGGLETGNLTVGLPVANKGSRVETQTEQQDHNLKVADKTPTGELNNTISVAKVKGKVLTAAVDEATKKYYEDFYGQLGPEGKEFAKALTSDYEKKVSAAVEETEGRVKRAFELAEVASTKGMCEATTSAKIELFNKIAKFDDNAFMAFKEAVEAMPTRKVFASETSSIVKTASKIPFVGQKEVAVSEGSDSADFSSLDKLGWN